MRSNTSNMNVASRPQIFGRSAVLWWLASFLLLSIVYASGVLKNNALPAWVGDYPTKVVNERPMFDAVSEVLTMNMIDLTFYDLPNPTGFPFYVRPDPRELDITKPWLYSADWRPGPAALSTADYYRSQIGLQGRAYAAVAEVIDLSRDQTYAIFRTFSAVALAAMLSVLIMFIFLLWGREAAAAALAFCTLSTGFNLFGWSLHWAVFLHVAPTALMAIFALRLPERSVGTHAAYFLGAGLLLMLTLATHYEFMTVTLAAVALPFFMIFAAGQITFKALVKYVTASFVLGVVAFVATLAIHDAIFIEAFGQSGLEWMSQRSARWGPSSLDGPAGLARDAGKVLAINSLDVAGFGFPNGLLILAALPFVWIVARAATARRSDEEPARIALVVSFALLASASWALFQFPHLAFHPRFSTIVVSFPFGILLFAALGRLWHLRQQARVASGAGASRPSGVLPTTAAR